MKKPKIRYRIKDTGEYVKFGDMISSETNETGAYGKILTRTSFMFSPDNVGQLLKNGVVEEVKIPKKHSYSYWIKFLSEKLGLTVEEFEQMVKDLQNGE